MLTIDQIKAAHGPKHFTIDVPEWGGEVLARRLSAADYMDLFESKEKDQDEERSNIALMTDIVRRSLINEDGSPMLTDDNMFVLTDSPFLLTRLGRRIIDLNGMEGSAKNLPSGL